MIDLNESFLNILKMFLKELKFIILYCINQITPGHLIYMTIITYKTCKLLTCTIL